MKLILAGVFCLLFSAQAAANDYSTLLKTHKFADVERIASAKLAQDPANPDALMAKAEAILGGGAAGRELAVVPCRQGVERPVVWCVEGEHRYVDTSQFVR